jgi:hypothetical protein
MTSGSSSRSGARSRVRGAGRVEREVAAALESRESRDSVAVAHFEEPHGGSVCGGSTRLIPCRACLDLLLARCLLHVASTRNHGRAFCGVDVTTQGVRSSPAVEFEDAVGAGAVPCPGCAANYERYARGLRERSSRSVASPGRVLADRVADLEDEVE